MRLNAYLASCGLASRRKSEELVLSGRIEINGKIVLAPFFQVDPDKDDVRCDGRKVTPTQKIYLVMNKPAGVVCAVSDKYDPVVVDLLPKKFREARVYPAGRLDRESEGLLILTNDGNFVQDILHPSKGIHKEYEALLNIEINARQLERWRAGFEFREFETFYNYNNNGHEALELDSNNSGQRPEQKKQSGHRIIAPIELSIIDREPRNRWVSVVIGEGLKREVRIMANLAGFSVQRLIRRRLGKLVLEKLRPGEFQDLSFSELYTKICKGGVI